MGCKTSHTTDIESSRSYKKSKSLRQGGCGCASLDMSGDQSEYQSQMERRNRLYKRKNERSRSNMKNEKSKERKDSYQSTYLALDMRNAAM